MLINSAERGPSIQPAGKDALHRLSLLSLLAHKTSSIEIKGSILSTRADPNDAIRLGARSGRGVERGLQWCLE